MIAKKVISFGDDDRKRVVTFGRKNRVTPTLVTPLDLSAMIHSMFKQLFLLFTLHHFLE